MNLSLKVIVCIAVMFTVFAACKKSKNNSVSSQIQGSWKIAEDATDTNGNGKMDPSEIVADTSGAVVAFNSNGIISEGVSSGGLTISYNLGTWSLTNGDTYVKVTDTTSGGSTTYLHIDAITSTSMTLKDTTGGVASWTIFTKQ